MNRIKLALFALEQMSATAIDRAGCDMVGGTHRAQRAEQRGRLYDDAMDSLLCGAPQRPRR